MQLRHLFIVLLLALGAGAAQAQTGRIAGSVEDASSGQPLPGANVVVEGTNLGTSTDLSGEFGLVNVPAGTHTITVSYLGYEEARREVEVQAGQAAVVTFALQSTYLEGEAVTFVGGQRTGQARALNQQRTADNIKNVVASDAIGAFPDPNAAEALGRIPAIAIQRDQGEGRYVTVRGTEPNLNNVLVNGRRVPSPEGDVRSVALDVIPAEALGSIEVNKTLTPDMEADAIGGSINLVTRSALDYDRPFGRLTLGSGYYALRGSPIGQGAFTYGTRLGANKNIGVMLNGSYYVTWRGEDSYEAGDWDIEEFEDSGVEAWTFEDLEMRHYDVRRDRASVGGTIDYESRPGTRHYLNFLWNQFGDSENRRRLRFRPGDGDYTTVSGNTQQMAGGEIDRELKDRYEVQRIWNGGLGGNTSLLQGALELDYDVSYSHAEEEEPDRLDYAWAFIGGDDGAVDYTLDLADPNEIGLQHSVSVDAVNNPDLYELDDVVYEDNITTDDDLALQLNAKYHLDIAIPAWIKTGFKGRMKEKMRDAEVIVYEGADADPLLSDVQGSYLDTEGWYTGAYDRYKIGLMDDADDARDWWETAKDDGTLEGEEDREEDAADYEATENIYAYYLMGRFDLNPRLMLLGGARMEITEVDYTGYEVVLDEEGDYAGTNELQGEDGYLNVLPALHARYRVTERTNARFAVSSGIARPNYYDLAPYRIRNIEDLEVERGNPNLEPASSWNVDLLGEHYFTSLGVLSGGFFFKTIENYIYHRVFEREDGWLVIQPRNAEETATLLGFEFAWNQQLGFLPGPLNGIGLYTNYSYTTSTIDFLNEDGEARESQIPGQSEHVANFALGYEKYGFSGRLSLAYKSAMILEVGNSDGYDIWLDDRLQLDFSASQRIWQNLRIYLDVINLTNVPYLQYWGDEDRPLQRALHGRWGHIGIKYEF